MGAVKQYYHDEILAMQDDYGSPEPDLLEMLAIDAQMAIERRDAEIQKRAAEWRLNAGDSNERGR